MAFAVTIAVVVSLGVVPPLPPEQREAIPRWELRPETLDEPGLYDLLNNAVDWPDSVAEQARGERKVDLELVDAEPDRWRGEAFAIEGKLLAWMPAEKLTPRRAFSRPGWDELTAWTVDLGDPMDGADRLIILLTDPPSPPEGQAWGDQTAMVQPFPNVRTVGRYFKRTELRVDAERTAAYPVFVGKTAELTAGTREGGEGDGSQGFGWSTAGVLLAMVIVLVFAFMMIRKAGKRGDGPLTRRLEEARARHEAEMQRGAGDYREDLPEDPTEALEVLATEHEFESDERAGAVEDERLQREATDERQGGDDDDAQRSG